MCVYNTIYIFRRESRSTGTSERRRHSPARSRSPLLEKYKLKKKISLDKKKSVSSAHKKDYTRQ